MFSQIIPASRNRRVSNGGKHLTDLSPSLDWFVSKYMELSAIFTNGGRKRLALRNQEE